MLEMGQILRRGGYVCIRDLVSVMDELPQIARALRWVPTPCDSGEGPHSSWKDLICGKSLTTHKLDRELVAWSLNHLGRLGVMRISELKG